MVKSRNKIIIASIILFSIIGGFNFAQGAITKQINYQGKLTNGSNVAVANGDYDIKFTIYNADSGGQCLWTSKGTCASPLARTVTISSGLFSVMLGDTSCSGCNALDIDFATTTASYYLGVTVGASDSEMTPRKIIGATAMAFNANNLIGDGRVGLTSSSTLPIISITASSTDPLVKLIQNGAGSGMIFGESANPNVSLAPASSTRALLQISDSPLSSGSISGTFIGANPTSFSGNFIDFQVNGSSKFKVSSSGNATTSGFLVIGTTNPTMNMGAGDLLVGNNATTTGALYVGKDTALATTTASVINGVINVDGVHYAQNSQGINAAIAALPSTGGKIFLPAGTYNITATININKSNVTLEGAGPTSTILYLANSTNDSVITASSVKGLEITNLGINGNDPGNTCASCHGISFTTVTDSRIDKVWVFDAEDYGIYLITSATDNVISNSTFEKCAYGIYLYTKANNNIISDNIVRTSDSANIALNAASYNTIVGNVATSTVSTYGIYLVTSAYNTITGNRTGSHSYNGIYLNASSNNTITANNVNSNSREGIYIYLSNNNTITANNLYDNGGTSYSSIYILDSDTNIISSNSITDTAGSGVYAVKIGNADVVSDNNLISNNYYSGLGANSISDAGTGTKYSQTERLTLDTIAWDGLQSTNILSINASSSAAIVSITSSSTSNIISVASSSTQPLFQLVQNGSGGGIIFATSTSPNPSASLVPASSTIALLQFSPISLASGSANGTMIGANLSSFSGNFLDFQVNGSRKFIIDSSGNATTSGSLSAAEICFAGANCKTAWPAGGSSNWTDAGIYLTPLTATDGILINSSTSTITNLTTNNATTTSNLIVGASSWDAPTNTLTISGSLYATGNATTSGAFSAGGVLYALQDTGYVGIGTTAPGVKLQVNDGDFKIKDTGTYTVRTFSIEDPDTGSFFIQGLSVGGGDWTLGSASWGANVNFQTKTSTGVLNNNQLYLKSTGNVGIGTTNPTSTLSVIGSADIRGDATTTGNLIVGVSSWAAPTNTLTVVGSGYFTGSATTSGSFYVSGSSAGNNFRSDATSTLATTTASVINKVINVDGVHYPQTGAGIQAAINALPSTGGKVFLPEGTYTISATTTIPSNVTLEGAGTSTVLTLANSSNCPVIYSSNTKGVVIANLSINGNKANNAGHNPQGIYLNGASYAKIDRVRIYDAKSSGIKFNNTATSTISNSTLESNGGWGGVLVNGGSDNTIINNNINSTYDSGVMTGYGMYVISSVFNIITGNNINDNTMGIYIHDGANNNNVTGNFISNTSAHSSDEGIKIYGSNNIISSNHVYIKVSTGSSGIRIADSTAKNNYIVGNEIGGKWGTTIEDSGTNTKFTQKERITLDTTPFEGTQNFKVLSIIASSTDNIVDINASSTKKIITVTASTTNPLFQLTQNGAGSGILFSESSNGNALAPASSTVALLQFSANPLSSGSTSGTYIGANPVSFSGNFLDFQVNGSRKFIIDSSGNATTSGSLSAVEICFAGANCRTAWPAGGSSNWTDAGIYLTPLTATDGILINSSTSTITNLTMNYTTTTGNLIVGTSSWKAPTSSLTVSGSTYFQGNSTTTGNLFIGGDITVSSYLQTTGGEVQIGSTGNFLVDSGVNVGIGLSNPTSTLSVLGSADIRGNATTTGNLIVGASSWAAPTSTLTVNGAGYFTGNFLASGNATTSGSFYVSGSSVGNAFRSDATSTLATTTASVINKVVIVDGVHYPQTSAGINAAITALGSAGGKVFMPEGTYAISETVSISTSSIELSGAGAGTILRLDNSTNKDFNIIGATSTKRIVLRDFKIDGNRANQSAYDQRAIYFSRVASSTIENLWIENSENDGIVLTGPSFNSYTSNDITVSNCFIGYNDNNGIYIYGGSGVQSLHHKIVNNIFRGNGDTQISGVWTGGYVLIANNIIQSGSDDGIYFGNDVGKHTIIGNNIDSNSSNGINLHSSADNTIVGNTIRSNGWLGITSDSDEDRNTISGNNFSYNNRGAIGLSSSADYNTITGNVFSNNSQNGNNSYDEIGIGGTYNVVTGNTIFENAANKARWGINETGNYNMIQNNIVRDCATGQISFTGMNTVVSGNRTYGIGALAGEGLFHIQSSSTSASSTLTVAASSTASIIAVTASSSQPLFQLMQSGASSGLIFATSTNPNVPLAPASTTISVLQFGSSPLSAGSANGTYLGANVPTFTGSFIDFQVGGTSVFIVGGSGNATTSNQLSIGGNTNYIRLNTTNIEYGGTAKPKRSIILTGAGATPFSATTTQTLTSFGSANQQKRFYVLEYHDNGTASSSAQWMTAMPDSYDAGTVNAIFYHSATTTSATSGRCTFCVRAVSLGDTDAIDTTAWGEKVCQNVTVDTANTMVVGTSTAAITIGGTPSGGDSVLWEIWRDSNDDARANYCELIQTKIEYSSSQESD